MLNGDALITSSTAPTLHDVIVDDVRGRGQFSSMAAVRNGVCSVLTSSCRHSHFSCWSRSRDTCPAFGLDLYYN